MIKLGVSLVFFWVCWLSSHCRPCSLAWCGETCLRVASVIFLWILYSSFVQLPPCKLPYLSLSFHCLWSLGGGDG
ncbi:hypothetical protein B0T19DRAFT_431326, partial [Cercophora scortea]